MKETSTYRLWTFQALDSIRELRQTGILKARWSRYSDSDPHRLAYQWMSNQMGSTAYAPIWAWHSCGGYGRPPTLGVARSLLSDLELEAGIRTIEFECPKTMVLLSQYSPWNELLDRFMDNREQTRIGPALEKRLFAVASDSKMIQATLPHLKTEWVIDIRALPLSPSGDSFDRAAPV
jgi:hypothetical protein